MLDGDDHRGGGLVRCEPHMALIAFHAGEEKIALSFVCIGDGRYNFAQYDSQIFFTHIFRLPLHRYCHFITPPSCHWQQLVHRRVRTEMPQSRSFANIIALLPHLTLPTIQPYQLTSLQPSGQNILTTQPHSLPSRPPSKSRVLPIHLLDLLVTLARQHRIHVHPTPPRVIPLEEQEQQSTAQENRAAGSQVQAVADRVVGSVEGEV